LTDTNPPVAFSHVPAVLSQALSKKGYEALTAVQNAVIGPEAAGRDLVVSAQTGSGKTVAFGLAMAGELLGEDGKMAPATAPCSLIIAPTRELALQVSRELEWLYAGTGARTATCVGGMDAAKERRSLAHGVHIVVGTPGRLRDHLERGALNLSGLRTIVLDEADEMLDMGFREDLEEILDATPDTRRTLLFSATMPKPIEALARRYQKNSLRISTVGQDRGHSDISYQAVTVAPADIENAVVNLLRLHEAETAMLFCATRDNVRHLHASLTERGFSVVALSGEHSQQERNHALQALRDRRARVCVATDVAARGIDLPSLSLVVHVEMPRDAEALQHRSGRTGRAGKKGIAVLLVPYQRRKRIESMLRGAKINADWISAPTPEDINAADRLRLLEALQAPAELDEQDTLLGNQLLETIPAETIAAMLVRAHRARMPAPEEMIDVSKSAPPRADNRREGFEGSQWFKMNIGRTHNADPRWILPLLCRRGHITRDDIGAIRITSHETLFEVAGPSIERFAKAVRRTAMEQNDEAEIAIIAVDGNPRQEAKQNRRAVLKTSDKAPSERHQPRPFGDKPQRAGGAPRFGGGGGAGGPGGGRPGGGRPGGKGPRPAGAGGGFGSGGPHRDGPARPPRSGGKKPAR
jgi:ATP-dependent RNA helicase DeaD